MESSAVIFDLDGTVHDRKLGIEKFALAQCARLVKPSVNPQEYTNRFVELDNNGLVWKDKVYEVLLREYEFIGKPSIASLVIDYIKLYPDFAIEIAGASEIMTALSEKGVKVGVLTNGPSELQRSVIQSLGFQDKLDAIVISEEVGLRKPQKEIFTVILEELGVVANRAIMVGDSLNSDVEGAIESGLKAIAFRVPSCPNNVPVCYSMSEVMNAAESMLDL